jgi:hypothetical protein
MKQSGFGKTAAGAHIAKVLPTSVSSLIVFLVVGIWHGANSKYIAFGIWNGGIIMFSILLKPVFDKMCEALRIRTASFGWRVFRIVRTFILVLIGYYFDIAPSFTGAMDMMKRSLADQHLARGVKEIFSLGLNRTDYLTLAFGMMVMFVISVLGEKYQIDTPGELLEQKSFALRYIMILLAILAILFMGIYGPGYDPADFVYMQF